MGQYGEGGGESMILVLAAQNAKDLYLLDALIGNPKYLKS